MSVDEGLLHAWLDGQLAPDEALRVERLVADDADWRAAAAEARGLMAASSRILGALDVAPPVRHATAIPRMTGRGRGGVGGGGRRIAPWMRVAAGLVLAVGVGAVVWESQRATWVDPPLVDTPTADMPTVAASSPVAAAPVARDTSRAASSTAAGPTVADAEKAAARSAPPPPAAAAAAAVSTLPPPAAAPPVQEQAIAAGRAAPPPTPPSTADVSGRGVAGGRVTALGLMPERQAACAAPVDSAGVVDTAARVVLSVLEVRPDSSVRAEWMEVAGRATLQGRQVGDTLRGAVRISAGDIRLPMQERVLVRVPCR